LIGIGWSSVMLLAWWRHGARRVGLDRGQVLEMSVLLLATEDAPAMPFKGELNLPDTGVLASLFCLYLRAARSLLPIGVAHLISYISSSSAPASSPATLGEPARAPKVPVQLRRRPDVAGPE
jgi:hypothetical protein